MRPGILLSTVLLLNLPLQTIAAQTLPKQSKILTLRLLNGKTGRPIWWRGSPDVYLGTSSVPIRRKTNLLGEEKIDVRDADERKLKVWVDFIEKDCRSKDFRRIDETYSIDEVMTRGIVSMNYCGPSRERPAPGTLVIYVIPMTLRELWNM
jgi:hypothetical protein